MSNEPRKVQSGEYTIIHHDQNGFNLNAIEEKYQAKYVGEFTLKTKSGQWANWPVSVFYQEVIPEEYRDVGSHHFGVYYNPDGQAYISNAKAAVENDWVGVLNKDTKEVLYSAYRHDYQTWGDMMADGGADYTKRSMHPIVKLKIVEDRIEVSDVADSERA